MKRSEARREALTREGIRRIGSKESGFQYRTAAGRMVRDNPTLSRIKSLRIPPAWKDVRIAPGSDAALQALGLDAKGRTQYLYHPEFRREREEEKFLRVVEFGEALPRLRRHIRDDLSRRDLGRDRVLSGLVRLIDQGFFRVGNDRSARNEETFGLTTVRPEHVRLRGSAIHFDFVGKWRKTHRRAIEDGDVARLVQQLRRVPGEELFKFRNGNRVVDVKDKHVNEYIQSVIGSGFTAKDFRTWAGTLLCSIALSLQGQAETKKERKKRIRAAINATAEQLGNTPAVCRSSYICPRLLDEYLEGKPFEPVRHRKGGRPVARLDLSAEERELLRFLRETIADRRRRKQSRKGRDRRRTPTPPRSQKLYRAS